MANTSITTKNDITLGWKYYITDYNVSTGDFEPKQVIIEKRIISSFLCEDNQINHIVFYQTTEGEMIKDDDENFFASKKECEEYCTYINKD